MILDRRITVATMLMKNDYGQPEKVRQVCRRCGADIKWAKRDRIWSPLNPETNDIHICRRER